MGDFETVDYIFILILLLSTLFGTARGFLREMFTLANVLLASLFTFYFFPYSYDFFAKQFTNNTVIIIFSIFVVFIVAWILIAIINSFLLDAMGGAKGSGFDRLMGTAFGLLRGMLIVISIFLGVSMAYKAQEDEKNMPEWLAHAKTYNFVKMQSQYFLELMPEKFNGIYKAGNGELVDNVVEALSPHGLLTDEQRKMLDYGLSHKNIETLKTIMHDTPNTYIRTLDFEDLTKLNKKEFKQYVLDLMDDYDSALKNKKIEPKLPAKQVESLRNSVNSIEEEKEDLYKGVY